MVETIRVFKGATELNHTGVEIIQSNDIIVNRVNLGIEANSAVTVGSTLNFTKADGSTSIFSAKVINRTKEMLWMLECLSNGWELHNVRVEATWTNKSPEYIVKDIVDNYTENLTFASSVASEITLDNYEGKGQYAIDIITDMMDVLQWQLRVNESDDVFFEPGGYINNGVTLLNGSNFSVTNWQSKAQDLVNHVKIIGGFISKLYTETASTTGTVFTLAHKPTGNVQCFVAGVLIEPDVDNTLYVVDADNQTITFSSSRVNPTFTYEINQPVIIEDQDESSISKFQMEVFKEISAPFLTTFADARKYARAFLSIYSDELNFVEGSVPGINYDLDVGELVLVKDDVRGELEELVINKIIYKLDNGITKLSLGPKNLDFWDWQRAVESRVKKLERRINNEDQIGISRLFKHELKTTYSLLIKEWRYKSPVDSFILGHQTLGRLRSNLNIEADCSDNNHQGVWSGTGIAGSQYSTSGYRLSCGIFNGIDNIISVTDSITSIQSLMFSINTTIGTQDLIQLASDSSISLSTFNITTTGLVNPTIYVDGVAGITITTGTFHNITITFDSLTCDAITIGKIGTSYFTGSLDEVQLFNEKLTLTEQTLIINKYLDSPDQTTLFTKCKLWLSMDNPRLGERFGSYVDIT